MDYLSIINKYYKDGEVRDILISHSRSVADKALEIVAHHPELNINRQFVEEAAMLHDIGVFLCRSPKIGCTGSYHYICHGYLGADLLQREGFSQHALVCERHTGTGISIKTIEEQALPLPHRDMRPVSIEEQVVCFADKFYSKSQLNKEKSVETARASIAKYGEEGVRIFDRWCDLFL